MTETNGDPGSALPTLPTRKVSRSDEDVGYVVRGACANIFANPEQASLKRVAWAYGCAKKDSDEESRLLELLIERVKRT